MTTLWGSNNSNKDPKINGEQTEENGGAATDPTTNNHNTNMARASEENRREPTERDRLLPDNANRHPRSDGYLDPDDPAVS